MLDFIRSRDEVTISQITQAVQLSKTTVWKTIDHFTEKELILIAGKDRSSDDVGKKPELFKFNAQSGYVISMVTFGTSVQLALTDAKSEIFYREIIHLQENEPLEKIISYLAKFIDRWQGKDSLKGKKSELLGIVLGSSGVVDTNTGVCHAAPKFSSWSLHAPVKEMLEQKVSFQAPFYIDNANRFFVFAEKHLGLAKANSNIVDIIADADELGAGIIAEDALKRGPRFITGEIGHMRLNPFEEELCNCGGRGCFEQLVSFKRLIRRAEELRSEYPESAIFARGDKPNPEEIFEASNSNDKLACRVMDEIIEWFAIAIHNTSVVFNAEIIIISGEYRKAGSYLLNGIKERVKHQGLPHFDKNITVQYTQFDEEGAVRGAACYVIHDYFANRYVY